jgi:hypothetical protein
MHRGLGKAKIHKASAPRNAKHTVAANHHVKGHSTIHVHKGGKGKGRGKKASHKTILK